jgi:hypothetical protein
MSKILANLKIVVLAVIFAAGVSYISAWTGPGSGVTPPNNNVSAPLNVGSSTQTKTGGLVLNGGWTDSLGNAVQAATGLEVFGTSSFQGPVQINTGSPQPGYILTAQDTNGTVGWSSVSGGSSGRPTFITPITLVTVPSNSAVNWTTVSNLQNYGVPATASAIILATNIDAYNDTNDVGIYLRPNSNGSTYKLAGTKTSGGGAPSLSSFNQSMYPVAVSSGVVSFDYKTDGNLSASTITLVGYIP